MVRAIISSYQLLSYSILHFDFVRNFSIERNSLRKMVYIIRQCQMNNTLEWGMFCLKYGCRVWKAEFESFLIKSVVYMATERDFFHSSIWMSSACVALHCFACLFASNGNWTWLQRKVACNVALHQILRVIYVITTRTK